MQNMHSVAYWTGTAWKILTEGMETWRAERLANLIYEAGKPMYEIRVSPPITR